MDPAQAGNTPRTHAGEMEKHKSEVTDSSAAKRSAAPIPRVVVPRIGITGPTDSVGVDSRAVVPTSSATQSQSMSVATIMPGSSTDVAPGRIPSSSVLPDSLVDSMRQLQLPAIPYQSSAPYHTAARYQPHTSQIQRLEHDIYNQGSIITAHDGKLLADSGQLKASGTRQQRTTEQLQNHEARLKQYDNHLHAHDTRLQGLENRSSDFGSHIQTLDERLEDYGAHIQNYGAYIYGGFQHLGGQYQGLHDQVAGLRDEIEGLQALPGQVENMLPLQRQFQDLEGQVRIMSDTLASVNSYLTRLNSYVDDLHRQSREQIPRSELKDVVRHVSAITGRLNEQDHASRQFTGRFNELDHAFPRLSQTFSDQNRMCEARLSALEAKVQTLESERNTVFPSTFDETLQRRPDNNYGPPPSFMFGNQPSNSRRSQTHRESVLNTPTKIRDHETDGDLVSPDDIPESPSNDPTQYNPVEAGELLKNLFGSVEAWCHHFLQMPVSSLNRPGADTVAAIRAADAAIGRQNAGREFFESRHRDFLIIAIINHVMVDEVFHADIFRFWSTPQARKYTEARVAAYQVFKDTPMDSEARGQGISTLNATAKEAISVLGFSEYLADQVDRVTTLTMRLIHSFIPHDLKQVAHNNLHPIVTRAFNLRVRFLREPFEYDFRWFKQGDRYDAKNMVNRGENARQEVSHTHNVCLAITPLVYQKYFTAGLRANVLHQAQVLLMLKRGLERARAKAEAAATAAAASSSTNVERV